MAPRDDVNGIPFGEAWRRMLNSLLTVALLILCDYLNNEYFKNRIVPSNRKFQRWVLDFCFSVLCNRVEWVAAAFWAKTGAESKLEFQKRKNWKVSLNEKDLQRLHFLLFAGAAEKNNSLRVFIFQNCELIVRKSTSATPTNNVVLFLCIHKL